jgi:hypothetical protein
MSIQLNTLESKWVHPCGDVIANEEERTLMDGKSIRPRQGNMFGVACFKIVTLLLYLWFLNNLVTKQTRVRILYI